MNFAEFHNCSTLQALAEWIKNNDAALYHNGYDGRGTREPSWSFEKLHVQELLPATDEKCAFTLTFVIKGNDPFGTIERMFDNTGLMVFSFTTTRSGYMITAQITPKHWGAFFVRNKLERSE